MAKPGSPRPPSVERVLAVVRERLDGAVEPRVLRDAAREVVDGERARLGACETPRDVTTLGAAVEELIRARERGWREGLVPVINATGVIVHTNLGRAPWPEEAGAIAIQASNRDPATLVVPGEPIRYRPEHIHHDAFPPQCCRSQCTLVQRTHDISGTHDHGRPSINGEFNAPVARREVR